MMFQIFICFSLGTLLIGTLFGLFVFAWYCTMQYLSQQTEEVNRYGESGCGLLKTYSLREQRILDVQAMVEAAPYN